MMMWSTRLLKLVIPALLVGTGAYAIGQVPGGGADRPEASAPAEDPEETIRRINREWGQAIVDKDAEFVAPLLAEDFIGTDREGNVFDKPTYLADLKKGFGTIKVEFEDTRVRVYGDAAVVTGIVRYTKERTQPGAGDAITLAVPGGTELIADIITLLGEGADRYASTYIKQRGRWRCVVTQASRYQDIQSATLKPAPEDIPARPIKR